MSISSRKELLEDVKKHPENHKHSYEGLLRCSSINGAIDVEVMEAHPSLGTNGGQKCDVTSGPCSCGAWHR